MNNRLLFKQENYYSCGTSCVKSILAYYKGYVPESIINEDLHLTKNGTNALFIINALKKYGFNAAGFKVNNIKNIRIPFIAHLNKDSFNHFVVVYKTKKKIIIMDPSIGFRKLTREEFLKEFSGVVITLYPVKKIVKYEKQNILKNLIKNELNKNKLKIVIITIIFINILFLNYLIASFPNLINNFSKSEIIFLLFLLALLVKFILSFLANNNAVELSLKLRENFNMKLLESIFKKNLKEFNNHTVGELVNKINNFKNIENLVINILLNLPLQVLIIIVTSIIFMIVNNFLFTVFLIYEIVYTIIVMWFYKTYIFDFEMYKNGESGYLSTLNEYLNSLVTIKSLNLDSNVLDDLNKNYNKLLTYFEMFTKKYLFFENSKTALFELFVLTQNFIGIIMIKKGLLSYFSLITLNLIITLTQNASNEILSTILDMKKSKFYINSLNDFLSQKMIFKNIEMKDFAKILIRNYSYSYDYINDVINIKDFTIYAGDKILINGKNGKGKSTFAKSLCGLFNDFKGEILFDGKDIRKIKNTQNLVIYTSKNDVLFNKTIRENIMIKDKENLDYLIKICRLETILKNKTLDDMVGDDLKNLSDGERSQIILARALAMKPKLLIVDELLSNLSESLENELLKNLLDINDLTLIYITHRKKSFPFNKILNL